jgi:hypothetical protein
MTGTQTWSPDTCECKFEQIVDEQGNIDLFFVHNVCSKHEPLVKNKPRLSKNNADKKKSDIVKQKEKFLSDNRERNLKKHDEDPLNVSRRKAANESKMIAGLEKHGLMMEAKLDSERQNIVTHLDRFESDMMEETIVGINSTYALDSKEVYDKVIEEQRIKNSG